MRAAAIARGERELARGLHPAVLSDHSLRAAVESLTGASRFRTTASAAPMRQQAQASAAPPTGSRALGGSLEVVSPSGSGTSLRAEIPID